jgi:hypothetical protein
MRGPANDGRLHTADRLGRYEPGRQELPDDVRRTVSDKCEIENERGGPHTVRRRYACSFRSSCHLDAQGEVEDAACHKAPTAAIATPVSSMSVAAVSQK